MDRPFCNCKPYHVYYCPAHGEDNRGATEAAVEMAVEMTAHHIASEVVRREREGQIPLGRNSLYNAVREAAIAVLAAHTNA